MTVLPDSAGTPESREDKVNVGVPAMVAAQLALVHESDYFTLLGVASSATGQEIRRAYLELRRIFEPARILTTPETFALADQVALIREILDEAYDVLRGYDQRETYRRAIETRAADITTDSEVAG